MANGINWTFQSNFNMTVTPVYILTTVEEEETDDKFQSQVQYEVDGICTVLLAIGDWNANIGNSVQNM